MATNNRVFIVHGHNMLHMYETKAFIESLGLKAVVLAQEDDEGLTIVEKFERHAQACCFAISILTPDDKQAQDLAGAEKVRARQNVILEVGWFMHKLGRAGVVMLYKGDIELPSDLLGILYLPFDKSIMEVSEKIRMRLRGRGMVP